MFVSLVNSETFGFSSLYLTEAYKGQHGEDRCCQRKDQQMLADTVPLKTSMHQERHQAEGCRGL